MSENNKPNNVHSTTHLAPYQWKAGDPSPNPGGRPKGLAAYIREHTMDGRELADFLIKVMHGEIKEGFKGLDRIRACELLLNRAFGTQPVIEGDKAIKPLLDLDKLTAQELEFIENVRLGLTAISKRIGGSETQAPP